MVQPIVSHTTYIAIGIIAVVMIIAGIYGMKANVQEIDKTTKLKYVADIIADNILEFKSLDGDNFEAKIILDPYGYNQTIVKLSDNLITVKEGELEVEKQIDMQMSGESYLPAYLIYKNNMVEIK